MRIVSSVFVSGLIVAWAFLVFSEIKASRFFIDDHCSFVKERTYAASDFDYFISALSFNRTRHSSMSGDHFLFRPGFTGLLAIQDILFRPRISPILTWNKLQHAIVSISLFFVLFSIGVPIALSLIVTLTFVASSAANELIFDIHLAPYMMSALAFALVFLMVLKILREPNRIVQYALGPVCFIGTCFNDALVPCFLTLAVVLCAMGLNRDRRFIMFARILAISVGIFLIVDAFSWFHYRTSNFVFEGKTPWLFLPNAAYGLLLALGQGPTALLIPELLYLPRTLRTIVFLLVGMPTFRYLWLFLRSLVSKMQALSTGEVTILCVVAVLVSYELGIALVRGAPLGDGYVVDRRHHLYFVNYLWLVLLGSMWVKVRSQRLLPTLFVLCILNNLWFGYRMRQMYIESRPPNACPELLSQP